MAVIKNLPRGIMNQIALYLNKSDLLSLATCSKTQHDIITHQELWKSKAMHDFGDIFRLYRIFTTSTGLELPTDLSNKFSKEPEDWFNYYITKESAMNATDKDVLLAQANREYEDTQKYLFSFQDDINYSVMIQVASKMLWILDAFPTHAGSYYILSYLLYIVNQFQDALNVLDMGRLWSSTFQPFDDLERKISSIMQGSKTEKDNVPVLVNENLSPELLKVLFEIFHTFDADKDDCLNPQELDQFVYSTNGQHPPNTFIEQMGQRFGANEKGWLTKKGYLAFYLEQTLGDPSETRKDIRAHGYDGSLLRKIL